MILTDKSVPWKGTLMNTYGYVRVSGKDQNEDRQILAMRELNIPACSIFIDKQSGKDFERPMYKELVRSLKEDDLLYVKSIDRLGRNYQDIVEQWKYLTRVKKVDIVVMEMPLLDTRKGKDLMGTFLSDLVLQILSFVAENERENIRSRQREGIEAAKAKGIKFGRPSVPLPETFMDIYERWKNKEITASKAAEESGFSRTKFYNTIRKLG